MFTVQATRNGQMCKPEILHISPTISAIVSSTSIKTSWQVCTATSSEDSWVGAYSSGISILEKLSCHFGEGEEISCKIFEPLGFTSRIQQLSS